MDFKPIEKVYDVAFDYDQSARNTFAANIAGRAVWADISTIAQPGEVLAGLEVSGVDVIIGGPLPGFFTGGTGPDK